MAALTWVTEPDAFAQLSGCLRRCFAPSQKRKNLAKYVCKSKIALLFGDHLLL